MVGGCGYHVVGAKDARDGFGSRIYIASFESKVREPYVENYLRSALIDWFMKSQRFQVVNDESLADFVLTGKISYISTSPLSYGTTNLAAEERIQVTMEARLRDRRTGKIVWEDKNITATEDYTMTDAAHRDANRRGSLMKWASYAAEQIYRPISTEF